MKIRMALCLALALTACAAPAPVDVRGQLTRARITASPEPLLLAELPTRNLSATMIPYGRNGAIVTWRTGDFVTVALDHGILVGTRGLGFDMMQADAAPTRRAIAEGPQEYKRLYRYLDGQNHMITRGFACRMTAQGTASVTIFARSFETRHLTELCANRDQDFMNEYWITDGGMVKSAQWVGPEAGMIALEHLSDPQAQ